MGSTRKKNQLQEGYELLGILDALGVEFAPEELFPDVAEEDERTGVNEMDLSFEDSYPRKMDFKQITDEVEIRDLADSDLPGFEDEDEYLERLFGHSPDDPMSPDLSALHFSILVNRMKKNKPQQFSKPERECLAEVEKAFLLQMALLFGTTWYESRDSLHIIRKRHQDGVSRKMMMVPVAGMRFETQNPVMRSDGTAMFMVELP